MWPPKFLPVDQGGAACLATRLDRIRRATRRNGYLADEPPDLSQLGALAEYEGPRDVVSRSQSPPAGPTGTGLTGLATASLTPPCTPSPSPGCAATSHLGLRPRRREEGKTDREIRRCIKRYLARHLYRTLNNGILSSAWQTQERH